MKVFCINDIGWMSTVTKELRAGPKYGDIDIVIGSEITIYGEGYYLERFGTKDPYHVENFVPLQEDSIMEEKTLEHAVL